MKVSPYELIWKWRHLPLCHKLVPLEFQLLNVYFDTRWRGVDFELGLLFRHFRLHDGNGSVLDRPETLPTCVELQDSPKVHGVPGRRLHQTHRMKTFQRPPAGCGCPENEKDRPESGRTKNWNEYGKPTERCSESRGKESEERSMWNGSLFHVHPEAGSSGGSVRTWNGLPPDPVADRGTGEAEVAGSHPGHRCLPGTDRSGRYAGRYQPETSLDEIAGWKNRHGSSSQRSGRCSFQGKRNCGGEARRTRNTDLKIFRRMGKARVKIRWANTLGNSDNNSNDDLHALRWGEIAPQQGKPSARKAFSKEAPHQGSPPAKKTHQQESPSARKFLNKESPQQGSPSAGETHQHKEAPQQRNPSDGSS